MKNEIVHGFRGPLLEPVKSVGDLLRIVGRHEVGDKVKLTVKRDGEEVEVPVELGAPEGE